MNKIFVYVKLLPCNSDLSRLPCKTTSIRIAKLIAEMFPLESATIKRTEWGVIGAS